MNIDKKIVPPVNVFYSYAHEDELLRTEINKHLSTLRRRGLISEWYDRDIQAGSEWKHEVDIHLEAAHIILLLISSDFMHSDYCYGVEMNRALERHRSGEARIIPIILRPVDWEGTPIAPLSVLPSGGRPVTSWQNHDEAFSDIAKSIRKVIELDASQLMKKSSTNKNEEVKAQIHESNQPTSSNKRELPKNIFFGGAQIMQDTYHISATLRELADKVRDYDYGASVQLRSLSDAVSRGIGVATWMAADVYKTIDPDIIVEHFRSHQRSVSAVNLIAESLLLLRNVYMPAIYILPLFSLLEAFNAYDRFVTKNPTQTSQSFLLLWIKGFGGLLNPSWVTPQSILTIELFIGLIAMLLNAFSLMVNSVNRRREQTAQRLREEITNALTEASTYLRWLKNYEEK